MTPANQTGSKCERAGSHPYNLRQALARFEHGYIANILELTRWDRAKAARMLGIGKEELALKIRDYQISQEANNKTP